MIFLAVKPTLELAFFRNFHKKSEKVHELCAKVSFESLARCSKASFYHLFVYSLELLSRNLQKLTLQVNVVDETYDYGSNLFIFSKNLTALYSVTCFTDTQQILMRWKQKCVQLEQD